MELVGDDDKALAVGLHVAHDGEQLLRLLRRQHGGRLIEDENIRAAIENLHDLHRLLLRNGHVVDLHVGINVKTVLVADLLHFFTGIGKIQLTLQTKDDVLRSGKEIDQLEVLMNHTDTEVESILGGSNGHRLIMDVDLSLVREVDAGEHVHQRCFTTAVFAQQRQNLAFVQLHVDAVVGHNTAEALGNVLHFNGVLYSFQGCHPFSRWVKMVSPTPLLFHSAIVAYLMNKVNVLRPKNIFVSRKIFWVIFGEIDKCTRPTAKKQAAKRQPVFNQILVL